MNLKQIILTAIITLVVTTIAGIAVNFYTNNYINKNELDEKLIYEIKNISKFKSDTIKISLLTIEITNIGKKRSENIFIKIDFTDKMNIEGTNALIERTKESIKLTKQSDSSIEYRLEYLHPNDKVIINIVANQDIKTPSLIVESSNVIGVKKDFTSIKDNTKNSKWFSIMLLTISMLAPILYLYGRKGYPRDLNNSAFLFLHNNQLSFAEKLLNKKILNHGATSLELSNLALIKYLKNKDIDEYNALLRMANFTSRNKNHDFIITFNDFIIACYENNELNANKLFEKAVKLNKKEFKKYLEYSLIIINLRKENQSIDDIISEQELKYYNT